MSAGGARERAGGEAPDTTRATRLLDWSDAALVASLESEAYAAFDGGHASALLRGLWIWDDDARRVRTRVPAEDTRVWIEEDGGRVHTAILVNTRLAVLQSAAYGFAVPAALDDGRALCEFTLAYSRDDHSIGHFHRAWDEAFGDLRADGFGDGFATCARRLLPLYRRMGARVVDETEIGGERRYFLHFELARTSRWNARLVESDAADRAGPAPADDATERLAFARGETGVALARLLVAMEIARGRPDPAVGVEARRRGAQHVLATVRRALGDADAPAPLRAALDDARRDADDAELLWDAVASFATLAEGPGHSGESSSVAMMTEALDALLLTLLEAWDGDHDAATLVTAMAGDDRRASLARTADGLRAAGEREAASHLERVARPFAHAAAAIARIAARLAARDDHPDAGAPTR